MILSGMVNSVMMRAHAVLVLTLHHGSVCMDLPDSTSDDIEVCICHDQDTTDEDTPIQLRCWNSISSELHAVKLILTTHLKTS